MSDTIVIYHEIKEGIPCPDGVAAAWCAIRKYPDALGFGWTYQSEKLPSVQPGDRLVIVDFSFPAHVMQKWADDGIEVIVIDHHETAMNNLSGLSDRILARFDMNECGATLAWKTFFPDEPMPVFLEYVRDRDLWNWLLPHSAEVHEAVSTLKYNQRKFRLGSEFALFDVLAKLNREELLTVLLPVGMPLVAPKREKVAEAASRHEWCFLPPLSDRSYPFMQAIPTVKLAQDGSEDRLVSEICMKLYRDIPSAPFVACICSDGSYSLRSDKHGSQFNVRAIAEAYGGGGHYNAAGFRLSEQPAP